MSCLVTNSAIIFHLAPFDCIPECRMQPDSLSKGVGMYYFAQNNTTQQYKEVESFVTNTQKWYIDVKKVLDYLEALKTTIIAYRDWFNGKLLSITKTENFFKKHASNIEINKMLISGSTGQNRYLNFDKNLQ